MEESSTYPASSYARERSNSGRGTKQSFPRCRSPAAIYLNDLKPSCSSHLFAAWKRNSSKGMQRRNICLPVLFRCLGPTAAFFPPARKFIPPDQLEASYLTPFSLEIFTRDSLQTGGKLHEKRNIFFAGDKGKEKEREGKKETRLKSMFRFPPGHKVPRRPGILLLLPLADEEYRVSRATSCIIRHGSALHPRGLP